MTPIQRARASAKALWESDFASQWMGLKLTDVSEGASEVALDIMRHHCNGHGTCHGGIIFALADSAFAFACNSRNQVTVAQHNTISYLAPGKEGDRLVATAKEVQLKSRNGIYDVTVRNQRDEIIAEFRGNSRAIKGQLFEESV